MFGNNVTILLLAYSIVVVVGIILCAFMTMAIRRYPVLTRHRSICIAGVVIIYELMTYIIG
jgi:hypothetical protein